MDKLSRSPQADAHEHESDLGVSSEVRAFQVMLNGRIGCHHINYTRTRAFRSELTACREFRQALEARADSTSCITIA